MLENDAQLQMSQLFAEGPIEENRRLRQESDEYLALNEPATTIESAERAGA